MTPKNLRGPGRPRLPKKERRTERVELSLTKKELDLLDRLMEAEEERSRPALLRSLIRWAADAHDLD